MSVPTASASEVNSSVSTPQFAKSDSILLFHELCRILTKFEYLVLHAHEIEYDRHIVHLFDLIVSFKIPIHIYYPAISTFYAKHGYDIRKLIENPEWL